MSVKVSIIVPVYNVEKYLDKCVESLLKQTYDNIEILLIDDESPDRCPQICDNYAEKDTRVRVVHQKNTGVARARKHGLSVAEGAYVSFVDSDDWILPSMISEMAAAAENQNADIVVCDWQTFSHGEEKGEVHTQTLRNESSMEQIRDEFLMDRHPNFMCNKLYRKELFDGLVFPGNMVFQDLYLNAEVFCRCRKVCYIPKPFYCYRIHASFASTRSKIRRKWGLYVAWREHERVCEKYRLDIPLQYSRLRAQQAVISLLSLNAAEPVLEREQVDEAQAYLQECGMHPSSRLSVKHKLEWWALEHAPAIARLSGRMSLWADERKQKRKLGQ